MRPNNLSGHGICLMCLGDIHDDVQPGKAADGFWGTKPMLKANLCQACHSSLPEGNAQSAELLQAPFASPRPSQEPFQVGSTLGIKKWCWRRVVYEVGRNSCTRSRRSICASKPLVGWTGSDRVAAHSKRHTLQILTGTSIARIDSSNLCDALWYIR